MMPSSAVMLAAGLGKRMRPLTETVPKPLVPVAGKPLIDHGLDALVRAGVGHCVVNVHHLADQLLAHLDRRGAPAFTISDERAGLLDSGGGARAAARLARPGPFLMMNADTFWIDAPGTDNLRALAERWDAERMDMLLLLAPLARAIGHTAAGDFAPDAEGRLSWSREGMVYAGAAIVDPAIFDHDDPPVHSFTVHFRRAVERGRLFGHEIDGLWLTVGTPGAIVEAEHAIEAWRAEAA